MLTVDTSPGAGWGSQSGVSGLEFIGFLRALRAESDRVLEARVVEKAWVAERSKSNKVVEEKDYMNLCQIQLKFVWNYNNR